MSENLEDENIGLLISKVVCQPRCLTCGNIINDCETCDNHFVLGEEIYCGGVLGKNKGKHYCGDCAEEVIADGN